MLSQHTDMENVKKKANAKLLKKIGDLEAKLKKVKKEKDHAVKNYALKSKAEINKRERLF